MPLSFAGAIAAMRFEQGDVLYRDRRAYAGLAGKMPKGLTAIQVQKPQRSARAGGIGSAGNRRLLNWQSEVTVSLIDLGTGQAEIRVLTQGKLAMALFSGDDGWLEVDRAEPPLPNSARDLQPELGRSLVAFDARRNTVAGSRFVFVVDLAMDSSRTKALLVEGALLEGGAVERIDLSPANAGVVDASRFHPSLVIRGLELPGRSSEEVLLILRGCLYAGGASAIDGVESKTDRFSIARHGLLGDFG
ncbi:MAG: hypothetical protein VCB25_10205 [Myxococcota bacterium]